MKKKFNKITKLLVVLTLFISSVFFQLFTNVSQTSAANTDFEIDYLHSVNYIENNEYSVVKQTLTKKVRNSNYYYPSGSEFTVYVYDYLGDYSRYGLDFDTEKEFKMDSLKVYNADGISLDYKTINEDNGTKLVINQDKPIYSNQDYSVTVEYKTHELVHEIGNIKNVFLFGYSHEIKPGKLIETDSLTGTTTRLSYKSEISLPKGWSTPFYTDPLTVNVSQKNKRNVFYTTDLDVFTGSGYLQFGKAQYAKFSIKLKAPKTDELVPEEVSNIVKILSTNVFELSILRDYAENNQTIKYINLSPSPEKVIKDSEGNVQATFEVPANMDSDININGVVKMSLDEENVDVKKLDPLKVTVAKYHNLIKNENQTELIDYLKEDEYWETDSDSIRQAVNEVQDDFEKRPPLEKNIYYLLLDNYNYVVDVLEYDDEKLENLDDLQPIGPKKALIEGKGVCTEYSDLLIALLRSQNIPSRLAFGYEIKSVDENDPEALAHQWVQVWIPEYGWLTMDPTWGESGKVYIGPSLEHFLWMTSKDPDNAFWQAQSYTADIYDKGSILDNYKFSLEPITSEDYENLENTLYYIEDKVQVSEKIEETDEEYEDFDDVVEQVEFLLKVTMWGKALVVVLPVCACGLGLLFLLVTITKLLKKFSKK